MKMLTLTFMFFVATLSTSHVYATQTSSDLNRALFVPKDKKILMFIGQDSDTIDEYLSHVSEDPLEGVTLYTNLKSAIPSKTLPGLRRVANWQSGDINFKKTLRQAPNAALAIGLAMDTCNDAEHPTKIAAGHYDASLIKLMDYFDEIAPRQVFLRIGYEFDGPWNCYSPNSFKAAFRYIKGFLDKHDVKNVATVWQSATWPDPTIAGKDADRFDASKANHLLNWYPGNDVVDWVSFSMFYRDLTQWQYVPPYTPDFAQRRVLDFARLHSKPVMIAEAAPQAYRIGAQTKSYISQNEQVPYSAEMIWKDWYVPFFDFIDQNKDVIRAVAYINANWESQGMWYCAPNASPPAENCVQGNWGDSRVHAHPYIKKMWLKQVNNRNVWLQNK